MDIATPTTKNKKKRNGSSIIIHFGDGGDFVLFARTIKKMKTTDNNRIHDHFITKHCI